MPIELCVFLPCSTCIELNRINSKDENGKNTVHEFSSVDTKSHNFQTFNSQESSTSSFWLVSSIFNISNVLLRRLAHFFAIVDITDGESNAKKWQKIKKMNF